MTANRSTPTTSTNPSGISGADYAARVAEEDAALYVGRINQLSSVGGTANAITAVCTPPLAASYQNGETFRLVPGANNSSTVTVNIDTRGAVALVDEDGTALTADDLVAGRPVLFWYHAGDNEFRLGAPTLQALLAALSSAIAAQSKWEILADTTVSTAVAHIEHTWTAGQYSEIVSVLMGVSMSDGSNDLQFNLRYASGSLDDFNTETTGAIGASDTLSGELRYVIDVRSGTRHHTAMFFGTYGAAGVITPQQKGLVSATAPDRIRFIAENGGNIDAGRIITYGLKAA